MIAEVVGLRTDFREIVIVSIPFVRGQKAVCSWMTHGVFKNI
jgi:hypothetical protein